ncbi:MAG: tetratricopeptide repeat protein [Bacteroidia bacterium]|nr:tetratricopeptide repeat protein [Bacteroidia bacterium]
MKNKTGGDEIPWGLYVQDDTVLNWRLLEGKASDPKSETKALNKIPGSHQDFVGRDKELRELRYMLQKEKPVLLLNGIGGIGKTTLARQYLHNNYFHFDRVLWVSVLSEQADEEKGFQTATEAIGNDIELLEHLGMVFDKEQSAADRVGEMLKRLRTQTGKNLLIIDNAGFSLEEIRRDLPQAPHWQVLITSRKELSGLAVKRLDELPREEALELFYLHYPQRKYEAEDVESLLEHIGYHTLTLELFAKTCQKSPSTTPEKILKLLQEKDLEKLSRKVFVEHSDREVEVYGYLLAAFELHELSEDELRVLIQWAVLPSKEISWKHLCQIFDNEGEDKSSFEDVIIGLFEKGWIYKIPEKDTFHIHQLVQELIRFKIEPSINNCTKLISGISKRFDGTGNEFGLDVLDKIDYALYAESILKHIADEKGRLSSLKKNLPYVLYFMGKVEASLFLAKTTLTSYLESFGENHPKVADSRYTLSILYNELGRYHEAHELLEASIKSDILNFGMENARVSRKKSDMAIVLGGLGYDDEATRLYTSAMDIDLKIHDGNHPIISIRRANLATNLSSRGFHGCALILMKLVLESDLERYGEDHFVITNHRSNLAQIYQRQGQYEKAINLLEMAINSTKKIFGEGSPKISLYMYELAWIYLETKEVEKALELSERILVSDLQKFGEQYRFISVYKYQIATIYSHMGKLEKAKILFEELIEHYGKNNDSDIWLAKNGLAHVYRDLGETGKARKLFQNIYEYYRELLGEEHTTTILYKRQLD